MKRKNRAQPGLFDAIEFPLLQAPQVPAPKALSLPFCTLIASSDGPVLMPEPVPETDNGRDWGDFESCLTQFGTNQCTLDGAPARVIGSPRADEFAVIEPVDLDTEPI